VTDIPASASGPGVARRAVTAALIAWNHPALDADATLVVSELVTNAVQHASPAETLELELILVEDTLRISLADGSALRPLVAERNDFRSTGRGLRIVEALTDQWGADPHRNGKRVWAELSAPAEPTQDGWLAQR
jgi:anti-sigma regulatory factor (Ser/Thr protein kinase)